MTCALAAQSPLPLPATGHMASPSRCAPPDAGPVRFCACHAEGFKRKDELQRLADCKIRYKGMLGFGVCSVAAAFDVVHTRVLRCAACCETATCLRNSQ